MNQDVVKQQQQLYNRIQLFEMKSQYLLLKLEITNFMAQLVLI